MNQKLEIPRLNHAQNLHSTDWNLGNILHELSTEDTQDPITTQTRKKIDPIPSKITMIISIDRIE